MKKNRIFIVMTIIILGLGIIFRNNTLAINLKDTYFVMSYLMVSLIVSILILLTVSLKSIIKR